jgi:hypothetical protein
MSDTRTAISENKPWVSQSMGCHPSQSKQFNEDMREAGIKCARMRDDGALECTSNKSRNQVMEFRKMFDRDGGYGNRTP